MKKKGMRNHKDSKCDATCTDRNIAARRNQLHTDNNPNRLRMWQQINPPEQTFKSINQSIQKTCNVILCYFTFN